MLHLKYTPLELREPLISDSYETLKGTLYSSFIVWRFVGSSDGMMTHLISWVMVLLPLYYRRDRMTSVIALVAVLLGMIFGSRTQVVVISLVSFTFPFASRIIFQSLTVLKKITNLSIMMCFLFSLFAYLMTFLYKDRSDVKHLFADFGWTGLTLLQILTVDAWGEVGRALESSTSSIEGAVLICTFIFIMTYFYMNISVGLVLETLQDTKHQSPFEPATRLQQVRFIDELLLGAYYQYLVFAFSMSTILVTVYHRFEPFDMDFEVLGCSIDDVVYTAHFIILLLRNGRIYNYERHSVLMMIFHFLAGPFSLLLTYTVDQTLGSLFNLTKLATTPIIKGIVKGTFYLVPILVAPSLCILNLGFIASGFFTLNYSLYVGLKGELYFTSLWRSFYTFFQVMTLDDWRAFILPAFRSEVVLPYIVLPAYIFISNFIFLNTFIALSCEYFMEIEMAVVHKGGHLHLKKSSSFNSPALMMKLKKQVGILTLRLQPPQTQQEIDLVEYVHTHPEEVMHLFYGDQRFSLEGLLIN